MKVHGAGDALSPSPEVGAAIMGRSNTWTVRRHIAAGGFGNVYEVEQVETGQVGALKLLRSELSSDRDSVLRFEREASLLRMLALPGIAAVHDVGQLASGEPFMVMELLHGEDLRARLVRQGRMAPRHALEIIEAVAAVLDAAHSCGVVHRDVKASNVFLAKCPGGAEKVVLLDFGLGKVLDAAEHELTASRQIVGTPASMAPEQILGAPIDGRTDVYGLGALAFSMLTGRPPFQHHSIVVLCQLHLHTRIPSVSALAPVRPALDAVVARAMSKTLEDRYPSCRAFVEAFREAIDDPAEPREAAVAIVCVRVSASARALSEADEAFLSDFEGACAFATRALERAGLVLALRTGDTVAFYTELPGQFPRTLAAARELRAVVRELRRALAARPNAHGEVAVETRAAFGRAILSGRSLMTSTALENMLAQPTR